MQNNTNNTTTSRLDKLLSNNKTQLATEVINLQDTLTAVKGGFKELESDYNNEVAKTSRLQAILDEEPDYELMDWNDMGKDFFGSAYTGGKKSVGKANEFITEFLETGTGYLRRSNRAANAVEEISITNKVLKEVLKNDRLRGKISKEALVQAEELITRATR